MAAAQEAAELIVDSLRAPVQTTTLLLLLLNCCKAGTAYWAGARAWRQVAEAVGDDGALASLRQKLLGPIARLQERAAHARARAERLMAQMREGQARGASMLNGLLQWVADGLLRPLVLALTRPAPGPDLTHLSRVPIACADRLLELCGDPPPVLSKCVLCTSGHRKEMAEACGGDLRTVCGL